MERLYSGSITNSDIYLERSMWGWGNCTAWLLNGGCGAAVATFMDCRAAATLGAPRVATAAPHPKQAGCRDGRRLLAAPHNSAKGTSRRMMAHREWGAAAGTRAGRMLRPQQHAPSKAPQPSHAISEARGARDYATQRKRKSDSDTGKPCAATLGSVGNRHFIQPRPSAALLR